MILLIFEIPEVSAQSIASFIRASPTSDSAFSNSFFWTRLDQRFLLVCSNRYLEAGVCAPSPWGEGPPFFCVVSFVIVSFFFCVTAQLLTFVADFVNSVDDSANSVDGIANFLEVDDSANFPHCSQSF